MNLPFIEQRIVSVEITDDQLFWIELNRFGSVIKAIQKGTLFWGRSAQVQQETLSELKKSIQGDTYTLTLSNSEFLRQVISEEIPFFDESEEVEHWIEKRKHELLKDNPDETIISHHVVELDEDVKRIIFQIADKELISILESQFTQGELPPSHVYTGVSELGYSHILNPEVAEGFYSILYKKGQTCFLLSFKDGILQQVHSFDDQGIDNSYALDQAHGFIQSEELVHQLEVGSTTLYMDDKMSSTEYSKRTIQKAVPHNGKKEFEDLPQKYTAVLGAGTKSFYPGLDHFEFISEIISAKAAETFDKLIFKKTAVLLIAPLVLFFLGIYVWNSIIEYQLQETSQVMEAIDDKLSLVQQQRSEVRALYDAYQALQGVIGRETNTAKVFTALNQTIGNEIELQKMTLSMNSEPSKAIVTLLGIAEEETAISSFMKRLTSHSWMSDPVLVTSNVSRKGDGTEFSIRVGALVE